MGRVSGKPDAHGWLDTPQSGELDTPPGLAGQPCLRGRASQEKREKCCRLKPCTVRSLQQQLGPESPFLFSAEVPAQPVQYLLTILGTAAVIRIIPCTGDFRRTLSKVNSDSLSTR